MMNETGNEDMVDTEAEIELFENHSDKPPERTISPSEYEDWVSQAAYFLSLSRASEGAAPDSGHEARHENWIKATEQINAKLKQEGIEVVADK